MAQPKRRSIAHKKIGRHRGKPRLWIEGRKLARAGVEPGQTFTVEWDRQNRQVRIVFDEHGDRRVSRKRKRGEELPVIDVNDASIEEALGPAIDRAKIAIADDAITVEVHPDDAAAMERLDRLVTKVQNGHPVESGSLAHGGGILDHAIHQGLADQGLKSRLAFAVELDQQPLEVSETRNEIWDADSLYVESGIEDVETRDLPRVDVLAAGLPCVGASRSGKAKNQISEAEEHPEAGALFVHALQIIRATNPAFVLLENVPDYGDSAAGQVIKSCLATWGYDVVDTVLSGNEHGALEDRQRLCLVGATRGLDVELERVMPLREKEAVLGEILEQLPGDAAEWRDISHLRAKEVRDKEQGKNFSMQVLGEDATWVRAIGAGYYKWRSTEPKIAHPDDPNLARQLTPGEHAAVKTVPRHLVENLNKTTAHHIMGNSVIWTAWRAVANEIGRSMRNQAGVERAPQGPRFVDLVDLIEHYERTGQLDVPDRFLADEHEAVDAHEADEGAPAPNF